MSASATGDGREPSSDRGEPTQPSLARMRRFDINPKRKLGQNFLIDNNILVVIAQAAALGAADIVLEIGGGLGVLSEYLGARVAHLHVVEIDAALEPALREALDPLPNCDLSIADAVGFHYASLSPAPDKLVANLPYGVAATVIIKAFYELPGLSLVCAMAQREVAERLAAAPGGKLYGATSVLVQAVSGPPTMRKLSRNIFHPVPNVDSSLITLRRIAETPGSSFVELVHDAFAHRRKPLPSSLAVARKHDPDIKRRAVAALAELGHDANVRAERLTPREFVALDNLLFTRATT